MTILARIGERLYEFDTDGDVTRARAIYIQEDCRSQSILEDMMDEAGIEYLFSSRKQAGKSSQSKGLSQ
jgi:hypothetical protein